MTAVDPHVQLTLRDGRAVTVCLLAADDVEPLARYFQSLSPRTRSFYGPHPFDRVTAEHLCALIGQDDTLRFVAHLEGIAKPEIIGYMILARKIWEDDRKRYGDCLDYERCACLAPSIADAYQEQGLGTQMGRHVVACAQAMGIRHLILMGGVQVRNERARRLYTRLGFRQVGEFWTTSPETLLNYDMLIDFGAYQD
jgi:diamine N-acetyltransferase